MMKRRGIFFGEESERDRNERGVGPSFWRGSLEYLIIILCKISKLRISKKTPPKFKRVPILKWWTASRNWTWTPTSWEVSTVRPELFSLRFWEAIYHSTKGNYPCHQQEGHHRPGTVRNRQNCHFFHRAPSTNWPQVPRVPSHRARPHPRTRSANQQGYLLLQWVHQG